MGIEKNDPPDYSVTGEFSPGALVIGEEPFDVGLDETLEFKATTGTRREAAQTACAMLNQHGGQVLFGVAPDGSVVGQHVSEHTIEELSGELQRIDPPALPTVERVRVASDREVLVVSVSPGPVRPYTYRGAAYRRVGNTTVAMTADEYNRMLFERMHNEHRWENRPATGWSIDDLDVGEIRRTVAMAVQEGPTGGTHEQGARSTCYADLDCCATVPYFGQQRCYSATWTVSNSRCHSACSASPKVSAVIDKMKFLDNREFNGNAFTLLAHAERFLRDTLPIAARFEPDRFERIDEPLYPPLATREALANALAIAITPSAAAR